MKRPWVPPEKISKSGDFVVQPAFPGFTISKRTDQPKNIVVEELVLKPIGDSSGEVPPAYCIVVDGKRSPLYFSRRQAEEALAELLEQPAD